MPFRGPAKGYIEALEHRLQVTENAFLKLLAQVSDSQLLDAFPDDASFKQDSPHGYTPLARLEKQGIEHWPQFPLDTADNIRQWQHVCIGPETSGSKRRVVDADRSAIHPAPQDSRKRKHAAFEETDRQVSGTNGRVSGIPGSHCGLETLSSPIAFHRIQGHSLLHSETQIDLDPNRDESNEATGADAAANASMHADGNAAEKITSSWEGAPSLDFQQKFLW
ncbi:uncharacterized protein N7482_008245 [Penicillium canariense]|uniref:Uncharacterized protein n=1 Tax=Penicillium canariense TaxID=189055 RepID=A0A9W9HVM7_9EURO|nr:uncharacterized protein N7482_008245 [Penicillium canariense]KAJ5157145.1 hypothetical protein N7482_008245 [Penicillium canariense]